MVRKVFFSFHFGRDAQRAGVVRNHGVTKDGLDEAGYIDKAKWESIKKQGREAVKKWIDKQLEGTSVTVVLIGIETSTRECVDYEIESSYNKGNGLFGVYIDGIKDFDGYTDSRGNNPFSKYTINGERADRIYPCYDWVKDNGYENFGKWVEAAAKKAGA
jgi:hypothetical protein